MPARTTVERQGSKIRTRKRWRNAQQARSTFELEAQLGAFLYNLPEESHTKLPGNARSLGEKIWRNRGRNNLHLIHSNILEVFGKIMALITFMNFLNYSAKVQRYSNIDVKINRRK